MARVRAGDAEAYADLVRRHTPMAVRTAALLGAGADTEDVVQDAFVKAFGSLHRFRLDAPFRPWLLRIVANETRNLHRARGRRSVREQRAWDAVEPVLLVEDPAEAALSAERRAELVRGLAGLSAPHREVLTCRFLLDLDEAETAAVLGWPLGTVKSRSHRAMARLRRELAVTGTEVSHDA